MKFKEIQKQTHPEHQPDLVQKYELLYEGGDALIRNAELFIPKRYAEGFDLYQERLRKAFFIPYVGPIIDYFTSNLFATNASIKQTKGSALNKKFYDEEFLIDVDRKGTDIHCFFKEVLTKALIHQSSYILIDFPRQPEGLMALTRAAEDELGLSRAYLVHFTKENLADWQLDEIGNFDWVKFHTVQRYKPTFGSPEVLLHKWYVYDKFTYKIFQFEETPENKHDEDAQIQLVGEGEHTLPGRVPVCKVEVPKGLWVMNKLASPQVEVFRTDNAMSFKEEQSHYAMPVIKLSEDGQDFKQKMGEAYYIKLKVGESFEWTEPEGKLMDISLRRRETIKDEMYRIIHQMSLSVKQTKSQTRQSGNSKQEDRYATEVILKSFGDIIRSQMQLVLNWISEARKDDIVWDVSGFSNFDNESLTEQLAQVLQLRAINIHSATFNKTMEKRIANTYLEDENEETKSKINSELEKFDFQKIVDDPMINAFATNSMNSGMMNKPPGMSGPSKMPEAPNGAAGQVSKKKSNTNQTK